MHTPVCQKRPHFRCRPLYSAPGADAPFAPLRPPAPFPPPLVCSVVFNCSLSTIYAHLNDDNEMIITINLYRSLRHRALDQTSRSNSPDTNNCNCNDIIITHRTLFTVTQQTPNHSTSVTPNINTQYTRSFR